MSLKIKLQSYGDVITNSSSELFTIKSSMTDKKFREIFNNILKEVGEFEEDREDILGEIWMEPGGILHLDYPVMCNLDSVYDILVSIFGQENVEYE